jgi:8-oxo-dGTP pyrophosphatase MutT (NUDIX family)
MSLPSETRDKSDQPKPGRGPVVRTDLVDVYVFTISASGQVLLLQLLRAGSKDSMAGQWHPVMGHAEAGETAVQTALRELYEEAGLSPEHPRWRGLWQLEQVHPFYMADRDQILLSPRLAARVECGWAPVLNAENSAWRWVDADRAHQSFIWPGQVAVIRELVRTITLGEASTAGLRVL